MKISEEDLKYIADKDLDQYDIKLNVCRICKAENILFKDGYTEEAKKIRWVDRTGKCYNYNLCMECKRERDRTSKRNKKAREESSKMS